MHPKFKFVIEIGLPVN